MGFTSVEDRVIVDSNGMVRTILKECPNINWTNVHLQMHDGSQTKVYNVFIGQKDGNTYLKVKEKYNDSLFEQVFGFGCECRGWDINRTIKIE
tara:strand:+ start:836 stop:1114 length:279 start_codon:yes stop_codon:yes gene_type:complete